MLVHIDPAQHVSGDPAHRVVTLLGRQEIDSRNAQIVDLDLLLRGDPPVEEDELLVGLG
jgi:hypothetical protein